MFLKIRDSLTEPRLVVIYNNNSSPNATTEIAIKVQTNGIAYRFINFAHFTVYNEKYFHHKYHLEQTKLPVQRTEIRTSDKASLFRLSYFINSRTISTSHLVVCTGTLLYVCRKISCVDR